MSDYESLTREQLERRLRLAENVCVMFGWMGLSRTERGKAAFQLWKRWAQEPGVDASVQGNRILADLTADLAAESAFALAIADIRDAARAAGGTPNA